MKKFAALALGLTMTMASHITPANANTLQNVQAKGFVQCGVHDNLPGFATPDSRGNYFGMDAALCRAVAAAVLGDYLSVKFTPLKPAEMQSALKNGEVDLLASGSWSLANDSQSGTTFVGPMYHDQVGFLVLTELGVSSAFELDGAAVCLVKGDSSEIVANSFFEASNMVYSPFAFDTFIEAAWAFKAGRCDTLAANLSVLRSMVMILGLAGTPDILPETVGFTMMGPQVRTNDEQWEDVVRWTRNALIRAEALSINSRNVQDQTHLGNPEVRRMLSSDGSKLGMAQNRKWAYEAIRQVGNYGEIFDRHIGPDTPIGLARGMNASALNGGLMVSPNF